MAKVIGIDFGLKRTGIAISDDSAMFAFGLETVDSKKLMDFLIDLKQREGFETIALGLPKRLNDEDSHITENVRLLKAALEKKFEGVTVEFVDERYTSKMAMDSLIQAGASKKQRSRKELIDKVSATLILQSFLEQNRNV